MTTAGAILFVTGILLFLYGLRYKVLLPVTFGYLLVVLSTPEIASLNLGLMSILIQLMIWIGALFVVYLWYKLAVNLLKGRSELPIKFF
jgi:hypothetical protein